MTPESPLAEMERDFRQDVVPGCDCARCSREAAILAEIDALRSDVERLTAERDEAHEGVRRVCDAALLIENASLHERVRTLTAERERDGEHCIAFEGEGIPWDSTLDGWAETVTVGVLHERIRHAKVVLAASEARVKRLCECMASAAHRLSHLREGDDYQSAVAHVAASLSTAAALAETEDYNG